MLPQLNATAARRTDTYIEHADTVNVQKIQKRTQDWVGSEVSKSSGGGGGGRAEPSDRRGSGGSQRASTQNEQSSARAVFV